MKIVLALMVSTHYQVLACLNICEIVARSDNVTREEYEVMAFFHIWEELGMRRLLSRSEILQ